MDNMENTHIEEVNLDSMQKKEPQKSVFASAVKGIALIVGLFFLGNLIGSLTNVQKIDTFQTQYNTTSSETSEPTSQVTETLTQTTAAETVTQAETVTETTTTAAATTKEQTTKDTTSDTKKEIVALFNSSANKIKKKAKKVTRNYTDCRYDEEISDYPAVLNLVALPLINAYLVKDDVPVEYTDTQSIKENYPLNGESYTSKLKVSDVASAKCIESKGKYEIELQLLYCKDPEENKGVCSVMNAVTLKDIQAKAPVVKSCSVEYYDCTVRCTVEKKSGNMIYAKYTQPIILNFTTQGITERQGIFALTRENEYVIEY